jgi:hypothetical protein
MAQGGGMATAAEVDAALDAAAQRVVDSEVK